MANRKNKKLLNDPSGAYSASPDRIHLSSPAEQESLMQESWLHATPEERIENLVTLIRMTYKMPVKLSDRIIFDQ